MAKQKLGPAQKKLVDALRSGEYSQGQSWLRDNGRYCVLGVAAVIYNPNADLEGCASLVGFPKTMEFFRLRDSVGWFYGQAKLNGKSSLALANDHGATFEEIADFIESNPSAVFTEAK